MTNFKINHAEKTIVITNSFNKKASTINSSEYKMLRDTLKDFPGYDITIRKADVSNSKETYKNLSFKKMEAYIREYCKTHEKNVEKMIHEFESVKKLAKAKCCAYGYTKQWFLATFPEYKDEIQMEISNKKKSSITTNDNTKGKEVA